MDKKVYNKSNRVVNIGGITLESRKTIILTDAMLNNNVLKSLKHLEQLNLISVFNVLEDVKEQPKRTKRNKNK